MSSNSYNYYYASVSARAIVAGQNYSLSSVEVKYGVNMIPQAILSFPIGQAMSGKDVGQISTAMGFFTNLNTFTPVQVRATLTASPDNVTAPDGKNPGYPSGKEFLLFDGYLMSPSYSRRVTTSSGNAALVVMAMGIPAVLANITQQVKGAAWPDFSNGTNTVVCSIGSGSPSFGVICDAMIRQITNDVSTDLWGAGIKNIFSAIIQTSGVWNPVKASEIDFAAFQTINTTGGAMYCPPLAFNPQGTLDQEVFAGCIRQTIANILYQLSEHMWVALIEMSKELCFKVIPIIDMIGVVPQFNGLGAGNLTPGIAPWRVIDPNEYSIIKFTSEVDENFFSYLTQVGVVSKTSVKTVVGQAMAANAKPVGFAHVTLPDDVSGRFQMVDAPPWLLPPEAPASNYDFGSGIIADVSSPQTANKPSKPLNQIQDEYLKNGFGDAYAQYLLYENIFEHRQMELGGRFRADIAPGSIVQVNTPNGAFGSPADSLYGVVQLVHLYIGDSAEGGYASTDFSITHLKTRQEYNTLTFPAHPVYDVAWRGSVLSSDIPVDEGDETGNTSSSSTA